MSKRSWDQANPGGLGPVEVNGPPVHSSPVAASLYGAGAVQLTSPRNDPGSAPPAPVRPVEPYTNGDATAGHIPMISRKIKACASCRKHKIKCIMDGEKCRRCREKNLGCVLNKSLQTLISERSQSTEAMMQDLEMMHSGLQKVMRTMNLPPLHPLHSSRQMLHTPLSEEPHEHQALDEVGPSCDNSPRLSPTDMNDLPKAPIHSVYHLTKLSALRSPDAAEAENGARRRSDQVEDLISTGALPLEDAERLFRLYMDHLDHFMYGIGGHYARLDDLRRTSRILAACIFTVAALHDPQSNAIYGVCSKEFRRLVAGSIFKRQIDRDYLRALSIGAYWLSDISWVLSGLAIRRASEFNLSSFFRRAIGDGDEDAIDHVRIWYILYICDQHLSTLFGRPPVIREDYAIQGWEDFISARATGKEDDRLASQVALLNILHSIRDLFGPDDGEAISKVYLMQIAGFSRQLDQWLSRWSSTILEHHDKIGGFPRKGALLHYHYAKLILYSHVFRGPRDTPTIPPHFLDSANSAVAAAINTVEVLIADPDIRPALVGMPSYMHSMTGFACMILARLAGIYGESLVEKTLVIDLTSRLIGIYRSIPVGKWHLMNLMANGLEKVVAALQADSTTQMPLDAVPLGTGTQNFGATADAMFPDMNFLGDYNTNFGASQLMFLGGFETADLSPTFF